MEKRKWSSYQEAIFKFIRETNDSLVVNAVAGSGKCLGYNTPVLMYDGSIKMVQDIVVGDKLMGDDSSARTVLSTTVGTGELRRVVPVKGMPWICNNVHILTLAEYNHGYNVVDIPINELESRVGGGKKHLNGTYRKYKLVRTSVEFNHKDVDFDAWLYGVWLSDGTTRQSHISTPDEEILTKIKEVLPSNYNIVVRNDKCPLVRITADGKRGHNKFRGFVLSSSDDDGKFIKNEYLINDRETRLNLLAGLLDSDGSYDNDRRPGRTPQPRH
jgi:replicative DNA helicase